MYLDYIETKQIKRLMKNYDKNHEKTLSIVLLNGTELEVDNDVTNIVNTYCSEAVQTKFNSFSFNDRCMIELYIEAKGYLQQIGIDEIEAWITSFDHNDIRELDDMEYEVQHEEF